MTVLAPGPDDLVARLARLDSCSVSDALDSLGLAGTCEDMHPVWEGAKAAGRLVTVTVRPLGGDVAPSRVHLGVTAIERADPGAVIVVDNGGRTGMGGWGGLLAQAAAVHKVGGVVVYGACRDVDEIRELGLPAFAVAPAARTARNRVTEVASGEPVEIEGVRVATGDLVIADGTAVVFVAADRAEEVVAAAERFAAREAAMVRDLRAGVAPREVLGGNYESMLVEER
jgi:4-hydroxy-4-methyl-2-oxoglutarate aldolase